MLDFSLILFFILGAFAQIPDYDNPYSPIFTDKPSYTWTDKVVITIIAPSWNAEKFGIDTIGNFEGNSIKLSTGEHSLKPYKLVETDFNSGIFVGELTLTGFLHDVDGDGKPDTNPRTSGNGPTNGFLETERGKGITISFEFADGVVLTHTATISWNIGTIKFLESQYFVNQEAVIRVIDPDMNLNPEAIDQIKVKISSDSDIAGITVNASETDEASGIFETKITFSQSFASSGSRLLVIPGDKIYAKYEDRTLPKPYSISDELDIIAESSFDSNVPPIQRTLITQSKITDNRGTSLEKIVTDNQIQVTSKVQNTQSFDQNFVYIIQVTNEDGIIETLSWIQGKFAPNQSLELSQSWIPTKSGKYTIEAFVWNSLKNPIPISPSISKTILVE